MVTRERLDRDVKEEKMKMTRRIARNGFKARNGVDRGTRT
jgi:hypothetical protein